MPRDEAVIRFSAAGPLGSVSGAIVTPEVAQICIGLDELNDHHAKAPEDGSA
jgi:hypothetical protein